MRGKHELKLLVVFSVAFSLGTLVGPSSGNLHLPTVQLAHANPEPCVTHGSSGSCSGSFWYPAGPAMNTELALIFTDSTAEYIDLQSASPSIDFPDSPLPTSMIQPLINSGNFFVTAPIGQVGYYEIEFLLANTFWGCSFNFGNAACGVQIRQGIAHMIDKSSFTNNDPTIAGVSAPIDNPVPTTSGGGLTTPNPCAWDISFPQSGPKCVPGVPGGTSYHLANAGGANGYPWLPAPGSPDLNAAAQHFVNAGLATGFNSTTSVLTGVTAAASSNPPTFFIRNDDSPRLDLGTGMGQEVCFLFTGSYTLPCKYLNTVYGPLTSFQGFNTCIGTGVCLNWWMYTAAFNGVSFFDGSLYFTYNSRLVSGIPAIQQPTGPCSPGSVPTSSASNYMYLCSPAYDSISGQMENAPSLAQAVSLGIQAEDNFGANAFTIPVFERTIQFGYPNTGWIRAINDNSVGLPNYFTWLNAWNPAPPLAGTIRQGFSQTTRSVDPYVASTDHDFYIVQNVYDSLYRPNPLAPAQSINWMTTSTFQLSNTSLTYPAPAHTLTTYRFTLRPDLYFQDGRPVSSYDVAFSYLSMIGAGSFAGSQVASMTGVTVLGPRQFDIGVSSLGPFTLPNLTSIPILPARYWTSAGSPAWDNAAMTCLSWSGCPISQYTLSGSTVNCALSCSPFSASLMTVNPTDVSATFDPIASHIFLGSGPWTCGTVTGSGSGTCTSTGRQSPPPGGSYTLTRFGNGLPPAPSPNAVYFRSAGNLALWTWAAEGMGAGPSFITFAQIAACFGQPVNMAGPCAHWQQGIGNNMGTHVVSINQVAIVSRFVGVNWVAPFNWVSNPPTGISQFAPVLYEGSVTLNPCAVDPVNGYDC